MHTVRNVYNTKTLYRLKFRKSIYVPVWHFVFKCFHKDAQIHHTPAYTHPLICSQTDIETDKDYDFKCYYLYHPPFLFILYLLAPKSTVILYKGLRTNVKSNSRPAEI